MSKTPNAFVIIHFGNNIKYFELELYFFIMLAKRTSNNIIYMYSTKDTPSSFVSAITPYVYKTVGFDDTGITYNVDFKGAYESFNTLRTCDFIFAYTLIDYEKICIVESDLVIMKNVDAIFELNMPAIVYYSGGETNLNKNDTLYHNNESNILASCQTTSGMNGGVILFRPSMSLFEEYVKSIPIIVDHKSKYPNEALFEYVNKTFYNLPVKYNLSHYHTLKLTNYGLNKNGEDVVIFHFNETDFKHLDIIKDKWLENNIDNAKVMDKYRIRKIPILYFRDDIYNPYKETVNGILSSLNTLKLQETTQSDTQSIQPATQSIQPATQTEEPRWVEKKSKKYDAIYWFNTATGESVWVKPPELKGGNKTKKNKKKKLATKKNKKRVKTNIRRKYINNRKTRR